MNKAKTAIRAIRVFKTKWSISPRNMKVIWSDANELALLYASEIWFEAALKKHNTKQFRE